MTVQHLYTYPSETCKVRDIPEFFLLIFVLNLPRVYKSSNFEYRAPYISRLDYSKAEVSDGREIFPLPAILFRNFWKTKAERQEAKKKKLPSKCFWGIITISNVRNFHV